MKNTLRNSIPKLWLQGFLKIILILALLVPVGFGYKVHTDNSGRLKTEQFHQGRKKQQNGYLFQIDILTFIFINLGVGGAIMMVSIGSYRFFSKMR